MNRVNGIAVEDYKDFKVLETGIAIPEAEGRYFPGISNGLRPDDYIVDQNLVLNLPFYKLKGTSFKSVDRYKHIATKTGALWGPQGYTLDGSDDQFSIPHNSAFNFGTGSFTLEAWFKTSTSGWMAVFAKRAGEGWYTYYISNTNVLTLEIAAGKTAKGTTVVQDGAWHHGVLVRDGTTGIVYLDGSDDTASTGNLGYSVSNSTNLVIGNYAGTEDYTGVIGEIRIYSRALSAAEVTHNYKSTIWRYQ